MIRIVTVSLLETKRELHEFLRIDFELVLEVEFLIHVLHHKVETVFLRRIMQVITIEIIAIDFLIILEHFLINWVLHLEQLNLLLKSTL